MLAEDKDYSKDKEQLLFGEFKKGRNDPFNFFFEKYYQGLCVYAVKIIGSEQASKDIVQDFFIRLWENREKIEIGKSVKSYFVRSVHNRCLDYISHQNIKASYKEHQLYFMSEEDIMEFPLLDFELKQKIEEAIQKLPTGIRETFILSRFEELSYLQIAAKEKISVKTVEYRISKALIALRKDLSDYLYILIL